MQNEGMGFSLPATRQVNIGLVVEVSARPETLYLNLGAIFMKLTMGGMFSRGEKAVELNIIQERGDSTVRGS